MYGPLKALYNAGCDSWMKGNPGKTMTIYDIPGVLKECYPRAVTLANILSGFRKSGIVPFNRNVFDDADFLLHR